MQESHQSKRDRVEQLLDTLALRGCKDTCIGDALARGISGGQAKRTNVGIALITNPKVLFLDGECPLQPDPAHLPPAWQKQCPHVEVWIANVPTAYCRRTASSAKQNPPDLDPELHSIKVWQKYYLY